jgi:thioredoxin reductase (NADPH)
VDINEPTDTVEAVDALVVGGGPAGLSAAIYLARARRSVVVFDWPREGRSDWQQVNFNYLGFPGGISIRDLTALGRQQAAAFGARFVDREVAALARDGDGFLATAEGSAVVGRAAVLATGVRDRWLTFPGYEDFIGRSLHWCIVCDGYEMQGRRVAIVGNDEGAAEMAEQMCTFTDQVTLVSNSGSLGLPVETAQQLERRGVPVIVGRIAGARARTAGHFAALRLEDGGEVEVDHVFSVQGAEPNTALARSIGVALNAHGYIRVDTEAHTSVPGVFAAGDVTRLFSHQVATAVHEGATAAQSLDYFLFQQDRPRPAGPGSG